MQTKKCSKCGQYKALSEFYNAPRYKGGFSARCKSCASAQNARWRRDNQVKVTCPKCQQERWVFVGELKRSGNTGYCAYCNGLRSIEKVNPQKREAHPRWRGGIQQSNPNGYIIVNLSTDSPFYPMTSTQNRVFQHRLVVAEKLGRCLLQEEIVHHLNGIRDDNRTENLVVVTAKTHEKETLIKLMRERIRELEEQLSDHNRNRVAPCFCYYL